MKILMARVFAVGITLFLLAGASIAQRDTIAAAAGDKYVISAKAGGVNFVRGTVGITRESGKSGLLTKNDNIEVGDRVSTGPDGMAEILLNPGSYLRLGQNSAFEFTTTSLDDLRLVIDNGSAIFEVFATEDFKVTVKTPKTSFHLIQSGVYRVDVANEKSVILVWKGRAEVADNSNTIVKSGREASVSGGRATVAKFDRGDQDALETWSKDRAKELSTISSQLERNSVRTALMRSFLGRSWNMYDSFGLWVYDPWRRNFCFLPFGYGWDSPYGFGYGHYLGWYHLPPVIYQPQVPTTPTDPTTDRDRTGASAASRAVTADRSRTPPFVRLQNSGDTGKRRVVNTGRDRDWDPSPNSPPVYSPPPSSPVRNNPAPPPSNPTDSRKP